MASPRITDRREIPELAGWKIVPVAAEEIGFSRQWLFDLITAGKVKTARKLPGTGARPAAIVVRTAEVEQLKRLLAAAEDCDKCRKDRNAGKQVDLCSHQDTEDITVPDEAPVPALA